MEEQRIRIHTSRQWVGEPLLIEDGYAEVELFVFSEMAVDERGMVNNGFIFGLGEYAAVLTINREFVFVERAEVEFLKPVRIGERLEAVARRKKIRDDLAEVEVEVNSYEGIVMKGKYFCRIYPEHLLSEF